MTDTPTPPSTTIRLERARDDVLTATRRAREARIAAAGSLRTRARRRSRRVRIALLVAAILAALLLVARIVLGVVAGIHSTEQRARDDALSAARIGVVALLTSDPRRPQDYIDRVLAVTTGPLHARLADARGQLTEVIAAQPGASSGEVLSAGLLADPAVDEPRARARVLLVADATDPTLVGADAPAGRITLTLEMTRTGDGWRISQAAQS